MTDKKGVSVSVLVVDDGPFCEVVCDLVRSTPGFELFGAARSGEEALELAAETSPDLVLLDVRLPGLDGLETGKRLLRRHPAAAIVLLSTHRTTEAAAAYEPSGFELVAKDSLSRSSLRSVWERHAAVSGSARPA